jgi:hypothetical protein
MAITVKHKFVSAIPDAGDPNIVQPSNWNDDHELTGTIPVSNGGTGASTLTGYVKGNGTAAMTASATVPSTDITGLGTMSTQNSSNINVTGGSISGTTVAGYVPTTTTITAGTGLSGGGDLSANRTLSISNTTVTAAAYGSASKTLTATVNAQGQLTALADTNIAITNTQVSGLGTASTKDAGAALGVATLDAGGKVPVSELPAAVLGALSYQGTWDASTNTPTLTSSVGTKGYYYVVSVAGSTNLNGITDWLVGDWAVYNGTAWQKVDNTDSVTSVNGATGAVVLTTTNIAEGTNLYYTDVRARASNSAGTGISYDNVTGVITNSAPDQTVALTGGTGISTSGTYPNFTITNTSPSSGGTVTSVATGTGLTGGPITSSGTISIDSTVATLTGTQTLTNKTLTSPKVNEILDANGNEVLGLLSTASATDYLAIKNGIGVGVPLHISSEGSSANIGLHIQPKGTGLVTISDGTDFNKGIRFRSSGSAASAITLLDAVSSAGHVITLPDATTTLVGRNTTDTLTNKSISGSTNTLSNIGNASLTNSAITINGTSTSLGGSISVGTVTSVDATAGTGISVSGGPITGSGSLTINNTAPDQTVVLTAGTGISTSGTYPSFTVTNTAPDQTVAITGAGGAVVSGTYPNFTITTPSGTVTSVTGTAPIASSGGATPAISISQASGSTDGYLSSTDWTTFNNKGNGTVTSVSATSPITSSGGATPTIAMPAATGSVNGYLTSTDWTTFNSKGAGTVTSVGGTGTVNGITLTGTVTSSGSLTLGGTLSGVNLASQVTGTLPIANGGTGATTAANAFNALSPLTTVGDILYEETGAVGARLPIGTTGQVLTVSGGKPAWATAAGSNITTLGLYENSATIGANYTIGTGNNAMSAGPITVSTGFTVTVPTGSTWTVV